MGPGRVGRKARLGGTITALALVCALVPFETAFAADSAVDSPPTRAEVAAAAVPAPEAVSDWREPTDSADAPPAEVVGNALKSQGKAPTAKVKVVSVFDEGGKPVIRSKTVTGAQAAEKAVAKSQDDPDLLAVEVDTPQHLLDNEVSGSAVETASADPAPDPQSGVTSTNDSYWSEMWGLQKLNAETAWQLSRGAGIKVAVVDTGVAPHVDLPANQILAGADFSGAGGNGRNDGNGHGTHVTGTIAASVNNGIGVAGLAPDVQILPVKVLGDNGSGSSLGVANGINWAATHGANIISMSLGGGYSAAMAVQVAYAQSLGVVVVAAAGNSRQAGSPTSYPAALPGVVGVAATDSNNTYAYFSNAGSYVDVSAPGVSIKSTLPGNSYASWSGTSMATPHVSAVAALILSRAAQLHVPVDVGQVLEATATDLGPAGKDNDYGAGLVNPVTALSSIGGTPESAPSSPTGVTVGSIGSSTATVSWTPGADSVSREFTVSGSPGSLSCVTTSTSCQLTGLTPQTAYTVSVTARNLGGSSSPSAAAAFTTTARIDAASDDPATPTPITPGPPVDEVIDQPSDLDYWTFTTTTAGTVTVKLSNLPNDYDLYLMDSNGAMKGWSLNWQTYDDQVQVTLPAGKYVALVKPYAGYSEVNPYRLTVTVPADPTPPPADPTPDPTPPPADPTPDPTPPPADPTPPPANPRPTPVNISRTISVGDSTTLPRTLDLGTVRWVNGTPRGCSLSGGVKVKGKRVGTCRLVAYYRTAPQLGIVANATIRVRR